MTVALAASSLAVPGSGASTATAARPSVGRSVGDGKGGTDALEALGSDLDTVAARHGWTGAKLQRELRRDDKLRLDDSGGLYYVEPALPGSDGASGDGASPDAATVPQPLTSTFLLHSRPGGTKVIYLDFDGHSTTGTPWNNSFGSPIVSGPYDLDGVPGSFSDTEQQRIQRIWARVADDFAPLDVDVTTQDPGPDALRKTSGADQNYGVRVVISDTNWFDLSAGGVAYVGSFDLNSDTPAFVFADQLGSGGEKFVAEATSHEAGHAVGLSHDGTTTVGYYTGHGNWAPIMGVGYYESVVQWSKGEYADANNTEDDLAVMGAYGVAVRADDVGNTIDSASALSGSGPFTGTGRIERQTDVDVFSFSVAGGTFIVSVVPTNPAQPTLDAQARLLNSAGGVVDTSNPASVGSPSISATVAAGTYYVEVDGVGEGTALSTGYSDYASLGEYDVTVTRGTASGAPRSVTGVAGAEQVTVSWLAPLPDGGGPITGYVATANPGGATCSTAGALSCAVTGLSNGTPYTFTVIASTASGAGPVSNASAPVTPRTVPGAPVSVTGMPGNGQVTVSWFAPTSNGGSPVTNYLAIANPGGATCSTSGALACSLTGLTNGTPYTFTVQASNSAGSGPESVASSPVTPRTVPGAPRSVTGVAGNTEVSVSWLEPLSDGGSATTAYLVTAGPGGATCATAGALSCLVTGLTNGTGYTFTVRASNVAGLGPNSSASSSVTPRTVPGSPTITSVLGGGSGSVTVSWSAGFSGGSPVLDFDIEYSTIPGFAAGTGTFVEVGTSVASTQTVSGLTLATVHYFRVRASNAGGDGTWSDPLSDLVIPCSPGSYSGTGLVPCTAAPPGSYVATTGAVAPTPCAVGTRQPATGQTACIPHGIDVSDPTIAFEPQTSTKVYAVFTVKLSRVYTTTVKVKASTVNGSAISRRDYTAVATTLTFRAGETTKSVKVRILGDDVLEAQEGFTLVLSKPVGAPIVDGSGAGVVAADPSLPVVSVSDAASVNEPTGSATVYAVFTVTLSKSFAKTVTVKVTAVGGTATKSKDFSSFSATVTFTAGVTTRTVKVKILKDSLAEFAEQFTVVLSSPLRAALGDSSGLGTVLAS